MPETSRRNAAKRVRTRSESVDAPLAYRYDIDGLRALAIALVVVYHVWVGRVSGGVDVFLMISAYFLTASLARRASRGDKPRLLRYWAMRFRRLMPPAAVTILGVLVLAYIYFPPTDWAAIWHQSWASLFYFQNWALAFGEVDYYNRAGVLPSPLQHFWSLSVQGQVFLLFPILIALVGWIAYRRRTLVRPLLIVVFAGVFAWSLWFSIVETQSRQEFAYFDTRTRVWEFAAGALVALLLPYVRIPGWLAAPLGWLGVIGIFTCGMILDVQGGFPGYLALWPVLCTAAVIVGGSNPVSWGPTKLLASRPMRFLGKDAYALYLVHWPVLITWRLLHEDAPISLKDGAIIVAISVVVARLLTFLVETPLRRLPPLHLQTSRGFLAIALSIALVATPLGMWQQVEKEKADALTAEYDRYQEGSVNTRWPGAIAVDGGIAVPTDADFEPRSTELDAEWVALPEQCRGLLRPTAEVLLEAGCSQSKNAHRADRRVLILGDSHAQQLGAPMIEVARGQGIGASFLLLGGCTPGFAEEPRTVGDISCEQWRTAAHEYVLDTKPDAVYLIASRAEGNDQERLIHGFEDFVEPFLAAGIEVIAVRDNPRYGNSPSPYQCVDQSEQHGAECFVPIGDVLSERNPLDALDSRIMTVDYTPWLCPDGETCPAVIGNVYVYMDWNHTTWMYGKTLSPLLEQQLIEAGFLDHYSGYEPRRNYAQSR